MAHPHEKFIENTKELYPLISLINESKTTHIRKNLSLHLHTSQINLMKQTKKHQKPHHRKIRIIQYQKLLNNPESLDDKFELHKRLYIAKYKKLEKKGLVIVNENPEEDLPFDVTLTDKGEEIIQEINKLEKEWEEIVTKDMDNKEEFLEQLKQMAKIVLPINYKFKKQQKFVF